MRRSVRARRGVRRCARVRGPGRADGGRPAAALRRERDAVPRGRRRRARGRAAERPREGRVGRLDAGARRSSRSAGPATCSASSRRSTARRVRSPSRRSSRSRRCSSQGRRSRPSWSGDRAWPSSSCGWSPGACATPTRSRPTSPPTTSSAGSRSRLVELAERFGVDDAPRGDRDRAAALAGGARVVDRRVARGGQQGAAAAALAADRRDRGATITVLDIEALRARRSSPLLCGELHRAGVQVRGVRQRAGLACALSPSTPTASRRLPCSPPSSPPAAPPPS